MDLIVVTVRFHTQVSESDDNPSKRIVQSITVPEFEHELRRGLILKRMSDLKALIASYAEQDKTVINLIALNSPVRPLCTPCTYIAFFETKLRENALEFNSCIYSGITPLSREKVDSMIRQASDEHGSNTNLLGVIALDELKD